MRDELRLGERGLEVELAVESHSLRDVAEQLVDGGDADGREHLLAVGVRQGEEAHDSASSCWYAPASSRLSSSVGSDNRIRTSQPSP